MKPVHDKIAEENFVPGKTYRVGMNGKDLYDAEVLKFHGGCWATVRVARTIDPSVAKHYTTGMEFDIKVANYEITDQAEA